MLRTSIIASRQSPAVARPETSARRMFHIAPGDSNGTSPSDDDAADAAAAAAASDCKTWMTDHFPAEAQAYAAETNALCGPPRYPDVSYRQVFV